MHQKYLLSVRVPDPHIEPVLDRMTEWFTNDRPDGFTDCDAFDPHVKIDEDGSWASVGFPAAERDMADFMVSLAVQECGLAGYPLRLTEQEGTKA